MIVNEVFNRNNIFTNVTEDLAVYNNVNIHDASYDYYKKNPSNQCFISKYSFRLTKRNKPRKRHEGIANDYYHKEWIAF